MVLKDLPEHSFQYFFITNQFSWEMELLSFLSMTARTRLLQFMFRMLGNVLLIQRFCVLIRPLPFEDSVDDQLIRFYSNSRRLYESSPLILNSAARHIRTDFLVEGYCFM